MGASSHLLIVDGSYALMQSLLFNQTTVAALRDADLSYTPPLSTPWDAVQIAVQVWMEKR